MTERQVKAASCAICGGPIIYVLSERQTDVDDDAVVCPACTASSPAARETLMRSARGAISVEVLLIALKLREAIASGTVDVVCPAAIDELYRLSTELVPPEEGDE